jgi:hypothetical protein
MRTVRRMDTDGRIGIVNHALEVVYESYVYVNPKNVVDWCTSCKSRAPWSRLSAGCFRGGQGEREWYFNGADE